MQNIQNLNDNCVQADAAYIVKKFRSLQDRLNFCMEKNWYHPCEPGFDATYFLLVLSGKKKYLPSNFAISYKMKFFRKDEKLDKNYLIEKMKQNPVYAQYTPDHIEPTRYSKAFLLNLIAFLEPKLFKKLYLIQKQQLLNKSFNAWKNYKIEIKSNLLEDVNNFSSVDIKKGKQTGFRKIKNHSSTGVFFQEDNNAENGDAGDLVEDEDENINNMNNIINENQ